MKRSRNKQEALNAVKDMLSASEIYQSTSKEFTQKFFDLKNRFNLPQKEWIYLEGYITATKDFWYRSKFVFCYVFDGNVYKGDWNTLDECIKNEVRKVSKLISGHFWLNKDQTIGRAWFTSNE